MKGDAHRNDAQTTRRASYPPRFDPHLRRRRKYLLGSGGLRMRAKGVKDLMLCTDRENIVSKSISALDEATVKIVSLLT